MKSGELGGQAVGPPLCFHLRGKLRSKTFRVKFSVKMWGGGRCLFVEWHITKTPLLGNSLMNSYNTSTCIIPDRVTSDTTGNVRVT